MIRSRCSCSSRPSTGTPSGPSTATAARSAGGSWCAAPSERGSAPRLNRVVRATTAPSSAPHCGHLRGTDSHPHPLAREKKDPPSAPGALRKRHPRQPGASRIAAARVRTVCDSAIQASERLLFTMPSSEPAWARDAMTGKLGGNVICRDGGWTVYSEQICHRRAVNVDAATLAVRCVSFFCSTDDSSHARTPVPRDNGAPGWLSPRIGAPMTKIVRTVACIDGSQMLYRAEFGFPARIRNRAGYDVTALFGFLALTRKALISSP